MNPIRTSLRNPQVTLTVLTLIAFVGVYSLLTMPRREDPKITIRQGLVVAFYPGANSAQVEDRVTKKLEKYLFQYSEVRKEKTYSASTDGMVEVFVELEEWVKAPDVFWSKLKHELLTAKSLDLPEGVYGPYVNSDFGDAVALLIALQSDNLSYTELDDYLKTIEDGLRTIRAVSKIKRYGEQKEQILVTSTSEKLAQYGVRLPQIVQVLQSQNRTSATGSLKNDDAQVPLYVEGTYRSEEEIGNQIVGTSPSGQVVRVKDAADISRTFAEPTQKVTVNGHKALMLSVEMQEGNNIVSFGKEIEAKLAELAAQLPSSIKITTVVNQPAIVRSSVGDFLREFLLAILSVIIVTVLLLPLRVAAVAATAIPVTIAVTFAALHTVGVELHQVSLASLILVLGMVVDDAIVIADNYVELLDRGIDRWTAAWRSATDLVVPVLTATVTIIAAFLPMIILTGSVGEFIFALPITVTIALSSSFLVATMLTPFLCHTFIRHGLHSGDRHQTEKKKRRSPLDIMQSNYDRALDWAFRNPKLAVTGSVVSVALAALVFFFLKQQFFPAAERNQFVVEVWMPTGTKLERTEAAVNRLENLLKNDDRIEDYCAFIGSSAPRFYYNYAPEPPISNYGQILVNTHDIEQARELADELISKVDSVLPEGLPHVRVMQQGTPVTSPVEVRIIGDDLETLKTLGGRIKGILDSVPGSMLVKSDFHEDYYGVAMELKSDANRLGFTTSSVATNVYVGFSGAPVTTMWEGNRSVDVVLRLDTAKRGSFDDLGNTYIASPVTGASVPVRQIASLEPQWQTGRIMHRNGVRTLTILCEAKPGTLPSQILKAAKPRIAKIGLPAAYRIEYGGEARNQKETFSQMIVALGISMILIFLILLFQFRDLRQVLLVMTSIPLGLLGALIGLVVTGNPFGFTAFLGLISLSGVVVRNAIILVDYANELVAGGTDIATAAMEAGKRRLRPIFLTAMAAAIGVLPMILSGSPLWSPLASVIAVGVVYSMIMTLLVVPVLYVRMVKPRILSSDPGVIK